MTNTAAVAPKPVSLIKPVRMTKAPRNLTLVRSSDGARWI